MKKLLLSSLLFLSSFCTAQSMVSLIGGVSDSDSQNWAYASWKATIVTSGGPAVYVATGQPVGSFTGTLSSTGQFSGSLPNNTVANIVPANTCWKIVIATVTSAPAQTLPCISLANVDSYNMGLYARQNITAPRIQASTLVYAYNPTEVINPVNGNGYINTISSSTFLWNGSWVAISSPITPADIESIIDAAPYNINNIACNGAGVLSSNPGSFSGGVFNCDPFFITTGPGTYNLGGANDLGNADGTLSINSGGGSNTITLYGATGVGYFYNPANFKAVQINLNTSSGIDLDGLKATNIANGTASTDAVAYGQLSAYCQTSGTNCPSFPTVTPEPQNTVAKYTAAGTATTLGAGTMTDTSSIVNISNNLGLIPSGGVNRSISFGTGVGGQAIMLYAGGTNATFGEGIRPLEWQFSVPSGSNNAHYSFSGCGTLNTSGTCELIRFCQTVTGSSTTGGVPTIDIGFGASPPCNSSYSLEAALNIKAPTFTTTSVLSATTLATDSSGNIVAGTAIACPGPQQTYHDITHAADRFAGVVYHNTSTCIMSITAAIADAGSGVGSLACEVGVTATPAIPAWSIEATATVTAGNTPMACDVMPGNYYEALASGDVNGDVVVWVETLHN